MNKKIVLGNNYGYYIDNNLKNNIINYLYSKLDLFKYRYIILNSLNKLKFLQENEHYISPNFKGINYLLIMLTINNTKYCVIINRKNLSYHKTQLCINTLDILQININVSSVIYDGSIFDGKLINLNNKYIFLIQDCFYLMGNKLIDMDMIAKLNYFDSIINTYFYDNNLQKNSEFKILEHNSQNIDLETKSLQYCSNFTIKLNKLYTYNDLEYVINSLNNIQLQTTGIIFYPKISGINVIHIDNNNNNKTLNYVETKSYDIIHNYIDFLKTISYEYEYNKKTKILWLNKSIIPDVYNISLTENGDKLGIALIPNLKISHLCDNLINDKPYQFNCVYSDKFKKWIPINPVIN